jgi:hypothetical protein
MRAIQLKCFYSGKPAPEVDRLRIQAVIDRLENEMKAAKTESESNSLWFRIAVLKGTLRPLRS